MSAQAEKILTLDGVHAYYGRIQALKGISLDVDPGEIVTLIGSNGAGKSTTLRSINGLIHPREGSIVFNGDDISRRPPHEVVPPTRRGSTATPRRFCRDQRCTR